MSSLRLIPAALLILLWTPAVAAQDAPADTLRLDMDQCVAIALSQNPVIRVADMEIRRTDYSRREAIGQLLPTVNFDGQYSRMLAKQVAYMNMDGFPGAGGSDTDNSDKPADPSAMLRRARSAGSGGSGGDKGIKMGLDNSYSMGFNASVPLIAPQLWQNLRLSDTQIADAVVKAHSSRLSMVSQVREAYYQLLLARETRRVMQQSYDMAALTHDIYVKRHAAGDASDYDVLRTSVQMKNVEPQLLEAEIAIKQARLQLMVLMGIDPATPTAFAGSIQDYETAQTLERALSLTHDCQDNPELQQSQATIRQLDAALGVQKAAWWPTLSAAANYNWTSASNGTPFGNFRWNPYSTVGLTLSVPIFQGGQRLQRQRQARIQLDQARLQRQDLERSVSSQVDLAIDNITLNVRQIASSEASVQEADRAHSIMQQSFDIGAATYLDLRDSELSLTQARLSYAQAVYNFLIADNALQLLQGTTDLSRYTLDPGTDRAPDTANPRP